MKSVGKYKSLGNFHRMPAEKNVRFNYLLSLHLHVIGTMSVIRELFKRDSALILIYKLKYFQPA